MLGGLRVQIRHYFALPIKKQLQSIIQGEIPPSVILFLLTSLTFRNSGKGIESLGGVFPIYPLFSTKSVRFSNFAN